MSDRLFLSDVPSRHAHAAYYARSVFPLSLGPAPLMQRLQSWVRHRELRRTKKESLLSGQLEDFFEDFCRKLVSIHLPALTSTQLIATHASPARPNRST